MLSIAAHHGKQAINGIDPGEIARWIGNHDTVLWVDILEPTEEDFLWLEREFRFHPLALEDVRNRHQRAKIDFYEGYAFIVFYAVRFDESSARLDTDEVEIFVGSNYIVTLHDLPVSELEEIRARWDRNATRIGHDVTTLLYSILDTVIDGYFPTLDQIADQLDRLEDHIFREFDPEVLKDLLELKRDLLALRRVAGPQRDAINILLRDQTELLPDGALPYLQDLYDHSLRVVEAVDTYREMVTGVAEGFLSVQSNNVNEIMRRLTIINLLFLPLAVLTGFFGMNFEMLPFDSPVILVVALLSMVALPGSLWLWIRRRGWG
jgi:magnesium transporter